MKLDKESLLLYAVTDRSFLKESSLYEQVKAALDGGVTFVQHREKKLNDEEFLKEAFKLKQLCNDYNVPFVINDNVGVAVRVNADGVHIGQNDMEASEARMIIGKDKILGVSVQSVEQAIAAEKSGADYLGVGAIFNTQSKDDAEDVSINQLKEICEEVRIPVVAIGGIGEHNAEELKGSGISGIAVISAIFGAKDITTAAEKLKRISKMVI